MITNGHVFPKDEDLAQEGTASPPVTRGTEIGSGQGGEDEIPC